MAQLFSESTNSIARIAIAVVVLGVGFALLAAYGINDGSFITDVGVPREQPVPFSHKHHAGDDGLDCRFCHASVETTPFAGLPDTATCMGCHSQIWKNATVLEPVRESFQTGEPIHWNRVDDLPDFVFFNHSIHIHQGIGCSTCHGRVDQMPLTYKVNTLRMNWCVNCHRHPEDYVRPRDQVFNMRYEPPADQQKLGTQLVAEYGIQSRTDCYTCHR